MQTLLFNLIQFVGTQRLSRSNSLLHTMSARWTYLYRNQLLSIGSDTLFPQGTALLPACAAMFFSVLYMPSYLTGTVSEGEHCASLTLLTSTDFVISYFSLDVC